MTLFEAIVLGLVQGLAEFLPVSSSGHLAVLQYIFGIRGEEVLIFAVMLHFGTFLSLVAVYYKDLYMLIKELFATLTDIVTGKGLQINKNDYRKLGVMIVVATIPTAFFGIVFSDAFGAMYNSLLSIGIGFLITGTLLWWVEKFGKGKKNTGDMLFRDAFLVGLFQSAAIAPGISRSGATIAGGLFSNFNRDLAVRFAFLVSIPPILGAVILESPNAFEQGMDIALMLPIVVGVIVAAVSGFIAIKTMIKIVSKKKLHFFSYYTWLLGFVVVVYAVANNIG